MMKEFMKDYKKKIIVALARKNNDKYNGNSFYCIYAYYG